MKIRKIIALTCVFANLITVPVGATVADYYDIGFAKFNDVYVNRLGQPIPNVVQRGIDVSVYQDDIDWAAVATDDVSFAFIRCGNTRSGIDKKFEKNAKEAIDNGIEIGLYYRTCAHNEDLARLEAKYTVLCAKKCGVTLPLVMDIEGSQQAGLGTQQLQKNIKAWCEVVEAGGFKPMIYASKSFMETHIKSAPCDKWIAQYGDFLTYPGTAQYWQCSSHGYIKGISGRVDIDFRLRQTE